MTQLRHRLRIGEAVLVAASSRRMIRRWRNAAGLSKPEATSVGWQDQVCCGLFTRTVAYRLRRTGLFSMAGIRRKS